jgi:hypothetical protein
MAWYKSLKGRKSSRSLQSLHHRKPHGPHIVWGYIMPYGLISSPCKNTGIYDKNHLICNKYHLADIKTFGVCLCYGKHYIFKEAAYDPHQFLPPETCCETGYARRTICQFFAVRTGTLLACFLLFAPAQRGIFHNRLSLGAWTQE